MRTEERRTVPVYGLVRVWLGIYATQARCICGLWCDMDDNYCGGCGERLLPREKLD